MKICESKKITVTLFMLLLLGIFITAISGSARAEKTDKWLNSPGSLEYPSAEAIILFDEIDYRLESDGSTKVTEREIIKILDPEAVKEFSQVFRSYVGSYQTVRFEEARIIKPDGTIINVDLKKSVKIKSGINEKAPLYNDFKVISLTYPDLEVSDIVEFTIIHEDKKPLTDKYFWGISYTSDQKPMEETRFKVEDYRHGDKIKWLAVGTDTEASSPKIEKTDGGVIYSWSFAKRPQVGSESFDPPLREKTSVLLFTTCPTWKDLSKFYYGILEPYTRPDGKISQKVKEITNNKKTPEDRIYAIMKFIDKKNKFKFGFYQENLMLFKPAQILNSPVITRMDATLLFISMLKADGFEAYPVLISDNKHGIVYKEIPSPIQFNNLIALVKVGKEWVYLDPTSSFADKLRLYGANEGQSALVLKKEGAESLTTTPISQAQENLEQVSAKAQLSSDNSIGVNIEIKETGSKQILWETILSMLKTNQSQKIVFGKLLQNISENAKLIGFDKSEEIKDKIKFQVSFMAEDFAQISGKYWIMKLPLFPVKKNQLIAYGSIKRKYPVIMENTTKEEKKFELLIPEGFNIKSLPGDKNIKNDVGSLEVKCWSEKNKIFYSLQFQIDKVRIPADDYGKMAKLYEELYKTSCEVILLEATDNAGNSPL